MTLLETKWKSDPEQIGEKMKAARKKAGLTQEQLAEEIGGSCTNKVISRYEKGAVEMGVQTLCDIAETLEVPINALVPERLQVHTVSEDTEQEELNGIFSGLNEEHRQMLLKMARMMKLEESVAV